MARPKTPPAARIAVREQLRVPIESLHPHPSNARVRDKRARAVIRESLQTHGQYRGLVVRPHPEHAGDWQLLAGHGTANEIDGLGWPEVLVDVVHADDEQAARIVAVDNRSSDLATNDDALLLELLEVAGGSGAALVGSGYSDADVRDLRAAIAGGLAQGLTDPDEVADRPTEALSRPGDVWLLGEHALVVGSATEGRDVDALFAADPDVPVDLVLTDPPYGVSYVGGTGLSLVNDDLDAAALHDDLLVPSLTHCRRLLKPGRAFYVCSPSGPLEEVFRRALRAAGLGLRQQLVWVKDRFVLGRQDYHLRHESLLYGWADGSWPAPVPADDPDLEELQAGIYDVAHETLLYGWRDGARHEWRGGRKQDSVWEVPRPSRSAIHPTMKPTALYLRAVVNNTVPGDVVYDPFSGSGTALIVCEQASRRARVLELDPRYADVAVARWQRFTGRLPVRTTDAREAGDEVDVAAWVDAHQPEDAR